MVFIHSYYVNYDDCGTAVAAFEKVSVGFAPWRVRPHQVRPHTDSSSDQVLQIYLSHTEKKKKTILCAR